MAYELLDSFSLDQLFGYQSANKILYNIIALASATGRGGNLGGMRSVGVQSAAYVNVPEWEDVEIEGRLIGDLIVRARVEVRTDDAGTSVTPKIRNVTDGTDAVVGVACSAVDADYSGSNQKQTLTFVPPADPANPKVYRLMIIGSNAAAPIYGKGHVEIYQTEG